MSAQARGMLYPNVMFLNKNCRLCCKPCEKVRRLPCEDDFCKRCLKDYISTLPLLCIRERFPCPKCGKDVKVPNLPSTKWTKAFKVDKRTQFYSTPTFDDAKFDAMFEAKGDANIDDVNVASTAWGTTVVPIRSSSTWPDLGRPASTSVVETVPKQLQTKRTTTYTNKHSSDNDQTNTSTSGVMNSALKRQNATSLRHRDNSSKLGVSSIRHREGDSTNAGTTKKQLSRKSTGHFETHDYYVGFSSNVRSDERPCHYWGGDTIPENGNILLADWLNNTVKMFSANGNHIADVKKLPISPLCVTYVHDNLSLITFGSRGQCIMWLRYNAKTATFSYVRKPLKGFLYSTTRFDRSCVGVFEPYTGEVDAQYRVCLARVHYNPEGKAKRSMNIHSGNIEPLPIDEKIAISSNSGIHYNHRDKFLYITERSTLYRLDKDAKLVDEFKYDQTVSVHYRLGCVTTLCDGSILVASDFCVLYLDADATLISVIPTSSDPYSLLAKTVEKQFFVLSNNAEVDEVILKNIV